MTTHQIPTVNLAKLQARVAEIARKAAKLGVEAPTLRITGTSQRVIKASGNDVLDGLGAFDRVVECTDVEIDGSIVKLAGWRFIAAIEHLADESGNAVNVFRSLSDEPLPARFADAEPACDHCRISRRRRSTYVVAHDDGRVLQVGSTCLADFTGHPSAEALASAAGWLNELRELADYDDEDMRSAGGVDAFPLARFLAWAAHCIHTTGWVSRSSQTDRTPTATAAWVSCQEQDWLRRKGIAPSERDVLLADRALVWARTLTDEPVGTFLYNLGAIARVDYVTSKLAGLAAAMLVAFDRELAAERAAAESKHVGAVGQRTEFTLTLDREISITSMYGVATLHLLHDDAGNRFMWKSSGAGLEDQARRFGWQPAERGDCLPDGLRVKATVKAHETYKGVAQTKLARLALVALPVPYAFAATG